MFLSCEAQVMRRTSPEGTHRLSKKLKLDIDAIDSDDELNATANLYPAIYNIPPPGSPVERRKIRRAAQYLIGPEIIGHRPVRSIVQYLGRKENTDEFYQLKILQLSTRRNVTNDECQGKMLIHTEYSLLSLLQNEEGIIKQHGLFSDLAYEEEVSNSGIPEYTGELKKRIVLVLDCPIQHPYCNKSSSYISLQEYIMQHKKLAEVEALRIFCDIVSIVENIHKRNVIHRDLKLGNIILNKCSRKVTLINFGLGKYLVNEDTLLYDQKGSPAYISPDVVCGKAYKGKPSDMWALGVVFYIMIYGNFPFFKTSSSALFEQILSGRYETPKNFPVSGIVNEIVKGLLDVNPDKRLSAREVRKKLETHLYLKPNIYLDQRVPSLSENLLQWRSTNKIPLFPRKSDQIVPKSHEKLDDTLLSCLFGGDSGDGVVPVMKKKNLIGQQSQARNINNSGGAGGGGGMGTLISAMHDQFITYAAALSQTTNQGRDRLVYRPQQTYPVPNIDSLVRNFISKLDFHFISGQIAAPRDRPLQEFNGVLTFEFASNLQRWLLEKFTDDPLVQQILINSDDNAVTRIKNLLGRCGVQIVISICGPRICRKQTLHVLLLLTYLLQVSGYTNTYFITQLSSNR